MGKPKTLVEAIRYYSDPDVCLNFMVSLRWPNGVSCPTCGSQEVTFMESRRLWQCKATHAKRQFSVKVGTIFEDSPVSLDKWLAAIWMIANDKNGVSSYELHRGIGVTQKTAWFMLHRIRLAMQDREFRNLTGQIEVDETFIGGKARFMHKSRRAAKIKGTGGMGKAAVMGLLERHGPDGHSAVRLKVVPNTRRATLAPEVRARVTAGADIFTDALHSYSDLGNDYTHRVIDHAERYVDGQIHTNGLENFWSLLKRSIKGTYISVEPFHLFRYLDEQAFRFNTRKTNDADRFHRLLSAVLGRRLTYGQLIGSSLPASA
jgi:transposase-like protein